MWPQGVPSDLARRLPRAPQKLAAYCTQKIEEDILNRISVRNEGHKLKTLSAPKKEQGKKK
jgi:hypothetical protein